MTKSRLKYINNHFNNEEFKIDRFIGKWHYSSDYGASILDISNKDNIVVMSLYCYDIYFNVSIFESYIKSRYELMRVRGLAFDIIHYERNAEALTLKDINIL